MYFKENEVLTAKEFAKIVGLSPLVVRLISRRFNIGVKIGVEHRYTKKDFERYSKLYKEQDVWKIAI